MSIEVRFRNLHHKKFKRLERRRKFSVGIEEKHAAHPTRTHPADFAYRRSSSFIQILDAASHDDDDVVAHEFLALFALEKRTKRNQKRAIRRRPTSTSQMSFYEHIAAAVVGL